MSETDVGRGEAIRWLRYAADDLGLGERLAGDSTVSPRHALWYFQQAAEKALKAALALEGIGFSYNTHDLDALCDIMPDSWFLGEERPDLAELTVWAVESRWPGEWAEPTAEDSRRAGADARLAFSLVDAGFRRRGVVVEE